jgi:hypothetical protein
MGPPGLLFNGTRDMEEGQFEPSRVLSFGPVATLHLIQVRLGKYKNRQC